MFKNGIQFSAQKRQQAHNAHILEGIAYEEVKLAHERFLKNTNLFTAHALTKASDNYMRLVDKHEAMGL